jgi:hypothetical protein
MATTNKRMSMSVTAASPTAATTATTVNSTWVDGPYAVGAVDIMVDATKVDHGEQNAPHGLFARVFYPVNKSEREFVSAILCCVVYSTRTLTQYERTTDWIPSPEYRNKIRAQYGQFADVTYGLMSAGAQTRLCWKAPLATKSCVHTYYHLYVIVCKYFSATTAFDVCIYSHGYFGARYTHSAQCAAWAANGHIVFAIEHRYVY